jgi:hypothetical protein
MKNFSLHDKIQIITGLAVLAGLMLVIIEMYQARVLATLQLTRDGYAENFAFKRQIMGENPAPILTKACLTPGELTETELTVVMAYYDYRYDVIVMYKNMAEISGDHSLWRSAAQTNLNIALSTAPGRVEFEAYKDDPRRWDPEIVAIAEAMIADQQVHRCETLYESWKVGLADL